jgi:hypothetical protein
MRAIVAALAAGAALAAAACGAEVEAGPPDVAGAAAKTEAAGTWRFEFSATAKGFGDEDGDGVLDDFVQHGHGEQDVTNDATRVVLERGSSEDLPDDETITVGAKTYRRVDVDGSKRWLVDKERTAEDALPMGFLGNPLTALDLLRATSRTIERVGEETIRGVRTVRSHAEVDGLELARAIAKTAEERREAEAALATGESTVTIDVWLDDDARLRRLAYTFKWKEDGRAMRVDGWTEYFDFGADIAIEVPRPSLLVPPDEPYQGTPEETMGACPGETSPYGVEQVAAVFRAHGFDPTTRCAPEGTYLVDERNLSLFCAVHERPPEPGTAELPIVKGNVECEDNPGVENALVSLR